MSEEKNNLFLINKILSAMMAYDKTEATEQPLIDILQEYLDYYGWSNDYAIYVDDDGNIKFVQPKKEELPPEVEIDEEGNEIIIEQEAQTSETE